MAPEQREQGLWKRITRNQHYDKQVDVYSMGLIFLEMICQQVSLKFNQKPTEKALGAVRAKSIELGAFSFRMIPLITGLVNFTPSRRPQAGEVKERLVNGGGFHYVCKNGSTEMVSIFLSLSPEVNKGEELGGQTPLHLACGRKDGIEIVSLLLKYSAEIDSRDKDNRTPLHHTCLTNGDPSLVSLLLDHSADVDARDLKNRTPLFYGCALRTTEAVSILLSNLAEVNARDDDLRTPLHVASGRGTSELVSRLLSHSAEVNAKDACKCTPLSFAEWHEDNADIVRILIEHGARRLIKTSSKPEFHIYGVAPFLPFI